MTKVPRHKSKRILNTSLQHFTDSVKVFVAMAQKFTYRLEKKEFYSKLLAKS